MDHISPTMLKMFKRCHKQFYFRYVLGMKQPPALAFLAGKSVHSAAEANHIQKIASKVDMPKDEIVDRAVSAYDAGVDPFLAELDAAKVDAPAADELGDAKDATARYSASYATEAAPGIQPIAVEKKIEVALPGIAVPLTGFIDCETEDEIIDLKTAGVAKHAAEPGDILQVLLYQQATGKAAGRLVYLHAPKSEKGKKVSIFPVAGDSALLLDDIAETVKAMQSGNYPRCQGMSCSWCGYRQFCNPDHAGI